MRVAEQIDRAASDMAVALVDYGRWLRHPNHEVVILSQSAILAQLKAALISYGRALAFLSLEEVGAEPVDKS